MSDPRIPSAERQEMLEQLHVNLRSVGMLKDALADSCVELLSWALAERDRADTAERILKTSERHHEDHHAREEKMQPRCVACESQPNDVTPCECAHAPCVHDTNRERKRAEAAEARANTAEAQCAELTIENLQLAVKAGMMADIPETELRARTAGRIAEVEDKLVATEARERDAVARADRLAEASREAGVHPVNQDTCGVCGKHFDECEEDTSHCGDGVMFPSCAGARIRSELNREATAILEMSEEHHRMTIAFEQSAAKARTARADAFAEVVAWLRKQRDDGRTTNGWPIDPYIGMTFEWLAYRIEELGKKGAG